MVNYTQEQFNDLKDRESRGQVTDEDQRLIGLYESQGYTWDGKNSDDSPEQTQQTPSPNSEDRSSTAPNTANPSKQGESQANGTAGSAGKSSGRTAGKS